MVRRLPHPGQQKGETKAEEVLGRRGDCGWDARLGRAPKVAHWQISRTGSGGCGRKWSTEKVEEG